MSLATLDRVADTKSGFISGIASSPATDLYGHSVRAGAFDHSIRTRGLTGPSSIKLLQSHSGLPIGRITSLRTVVQDLRLEGELNMELSSVRDLHSVIKHSGGLNFSVGFKIEEFDLADEKNLKPGQPWIVIKRGDLIEVSVVTFPACAEATMDFKQARPQWFNEALGDIDLKARGDGAEESRGDALNQAHRAAAQPPQPVASMALLTEQRQ